MFQILLVFINIRFTFYLLQDNNAVLSQPPSMTEVPGILFIYSDLKGLYFWN